MTTSGWRERESLRQARLVASVLATRHLRRLAFEAGVRTVSRRWLLVAAIAAAVVALLVAWLAGTIAAALTTRYAPAPAAVLGGAIVLALAAPWLVGTMSAVVAAASHVDRSHTLVRQAFCSSLVPVLARMAFPALLKAVAVSLLLGVVTWPIWRLTGAPTAGSAAVAGALVAYAVLVVVLRTVLLGMRLRSVALVRRGRLGLPLIATVVIVQCAAVFAAAHGLSTWLSSADVTGLLGRLGDAVASLASSSAVVAVPLGLTAVVGLLTPVALRSLDAGLARVTAELRHNAARQRAAAVPPPMPADPVRALIAKDVRRARRSGGPIIGPSVATTAWGVVLACGLLGVTTSGLLPGTDNPIVLGFQLLVAALVALEFASVGIRPITSPDADGAAARLVLATPRGRERSVRAKATLHSTILGAVAVGSLGILTAVLEVTVGGALSLVVLLVGGIVLATLEHVGAPAAHPRLDWTSLEQIGGNPKAQALGLTISVVGIMAVNALAAPLTRVELAVPFRVGVVALLVTAAVLVSPWLARSATSLLLRRFA